LTFERVTTPAQVEAVRQIRNTGYLGLFDQRVITEEEQASWWETHRAQARIWLTTDGDEPTGFLSLTERYGVDFVTLVVTPAHRSHGIGTAIYREAPHLAGRPVYAAMWRWNDTSYVAAVKAGYHEALKPVAFEGWEIRVLESDAPRQ